MKGLLNAELYKLKKSLGYKLMILGVIVYAISDLYFQVMADNTGELFGVQAFADSFGSWTRSYLISAIFAGLFIAGDFANRGIQTQISVGKSRIAVLLSKSAVYWLGCIGIALLYQFVYIAGTCIFYGFGKGLNIELFYCYVQLEIAYLFLFSGLLSICILIAFCLRDIFAVTVAEVIFVAVGISIMNSFARIGEIPKLLYNNSLVGKLSRLYQFAMKEVEDEILHYKRLEVMQPDEILENFNLEWANGVWLEIGMAIVTAVIIFEITYLIFRKVDLK